MNIIVSFKIRSKHNWTPKEQHHTIDTLIYLVDYNTGNVKRRKTKHPKTQINKERKTAMEKVAENRNIIWTNDDTGAAVVIMNTDDYIN